MAGKQKLKIVNSIPKSIKFVQGSKIINLGTIRYKDLPKNIDTIVWGKYKVIPRLINPEGFDSSTCCSVSSTENPVDGVYTGRRLTIGATNYVYYGEHLVWTYKAKPGYEITGNTAITVTNDTEFNLTAKKLDYGDRLIVSYTSGYNNGLYVDVSYTPLAKVAGIFNLTISLTNKDRYHDYEHFLDKKQENAAVRYNEGSHQIRLSTNWYGDGYDIEIKGTFTPDNGGSKTDLKTYYSDSVTSSDRE